tara:strand:+ start:528 stop:950 length:423 start_codon:yes stop_codon:yes gene_type:complete
MVNTDGVSVMFTTHTDGLYDGADTVYCVPWRNFRGFRKVDTDPTHLTLLFEPLLKRYDATLGDTTTNDTVQLEITTQKQKEVMQDISKAVLDAAKTNNFVVVLDKNNLGDSATAVAAGPNNSCSKFISRVLSITFDNPDS